MSHCSSQDSRRALGFEFCDGSVEGRRRETAELSVRLRQDFSKACMLISHLELPSESVVPQETRPRLLSRRRRRTRFPFSSFPPSPVVHRHAHASWTWINIFPAWWLPASTISYLAEYLLPAERRLSSRDSVLRSGRRVPNYDLRTDAEGTISQRDYRARSNGGPRLYYRHP